MCVHVCVMLVFSVLGVGLPDQPVTLGLTFGGTAKWFSKAAAPFWIFVINAQGSNFSTSYLPF